MKAETKTSARKHTATNPHAQIRPGTKLARVLTALAEGQTMTRFEAERRVHDHTLNSTICEIEKRGLIVSRKGEVVPGFGGAPTHCCRYWLAEDQREHAWRLLGINP